MGITTYMGNPPTKTMHYMLSQYGMFYDIDHAEYNDNCTIIFLRNSTKPIVIPTTSSTITADDIDQVVENRDDIVEVRYSMHVTMIDDNAFENCTNLASVQGPYGNNLWVIGSRAFARCINLKYFEVDTYNVVEIANDAFVGCQIEEIGCKFMPGDEWTNLTAEDEAWSELMKSKILNQSTPLLSTNRMIMFAANNASSGRLKGKRDGKKPPCLHEDRITANDKPTSETHYINGIGHEDTVIVKGFVCRTCWYSNVTKTTKCPYDNK